MPVRRSSCCACVAVACALAGAPAASGADVLVLGEDGRARVHESRFTPSADLPEPPRAAARPVATAAKRRTVIGELKRLVRRGVLSPEEYTTRRAAYVDAKKTARRLSGLREAELGAVVRTLDEIAARRQLTRSRLPALWATLEANRRWWT